VYSRLKNMDYHGLNFEINNPGGPANPFNVIWGGIHLGLNIQ
jgi:hypothetical protein